MKWYAAAGMVLLLALMLKLSLLAYAMYSIFGILFVSRFLAQHWSTNLIASRTISDREAKIGMVVSVAVTVTNQSNLPIVWVLCEDVLPREALLFEPPRLAVTGRRLQLLFLWGKQRHTFFYQMRCNRRGFFQIGPLVAETGDLFGLHRRFRLLTEPDFLLVEPQPTAMDGYYLESRRPIGEIQMTHRLFEDPSRLSGCRNYQPGDPLQRIHWPATARCGSLQTKVFEPSSVAGVTLLLDFDRRTYVKKDEPFRSELAITVAASLAQDLLRTGQQVGLISNGRDAAERIRTEGWKSDARTRTDAHRAAQMREGQDRLRPVRLKTGRTPQQFDQCMKLLARLELNEGLTLPELVHETAHDLPRDATIVVILSQVEPDDALALGELFRRGYAVTALINVYDDDVFVDFAAQLAAVRVGCRHLKDFDHVTTICQRLTLRWTA